MDAAAKNAGGVRPGAYVVGRLWAGDDIAMRHQYTRAELEQLPKEHPVWIEGVGLRQLQWGGWEIATHIHNERLCLKHEADSRGLLLSLYSQVWVAFDGPPEE